MTSQIYESYVPVYDTVPEKWDDARPFLVETLRKITDSLNVKEIAFHLDEQLLTGGNFIPSVASQGQFRSIFRKVIDCSPLVSGANSFGHDINVNANFTLIDLWVGATDSVGFTSQVITGNDVDMDVTNININSPAAYDRAYAIVEYILEG